MFLVVLDKICVFCLYPIPDSQQYVKRGSCRRLILSALLCLFSFLGLGPMCDEFRTWASNLVFLSCLFYFLESWSRFVLICLFRVYSVFNRYLSLKVMFVFVSYHVVFFVFIYIKCHLIVFRNLIVLLIISCMSLVIICSYHFSYLNVSHILNISYLTMIHILKYCFV